MIMRSERSDNKCGLGVKLELSVNFLSTSFAYNKISHEKMFIYNFTSKDV